MYKSNKKPVFAVNKASVVLVLSWTQCILLWLPSCVSWDGRNSLHFSLKQNLKYKMATITKNKVKYKCFSDNNDKKCRFNTNMNKFLRQKNILLVFILGLNISLVNGQNSYYNHQNWLRDRDPRFYSREGVDYKPPDPGDPNYR